MSILQDVLKAPAIAGTLIAELRRQEGRTSATYLKKAGLPAPTAINVIRSAKIAAQPLQYRRRVVRDRKPRFEFERDLRRDHYAKIPAEALDSAITVTDYCARYFEEHRSEIEQSYESPYALVFKTEVTGKAPRLVNPKAMAPIVNYIAHSELNGIIERYLGERPVIAGISLMYTKPNADVISSQQFHQDLNDANQINLVMPVWPIAIDGGPFTLVPGQDTAKVLKAVGLRKARISDEEVYAVIPEERTVKLIGEPGDAYFCNPWKCLHFGARARTKPRLVLIVNIVSKFEGLEMMDRLYRAENRAELDDGTPEVQSLLDL